MKRVVSFLDIYDEIPQNAKYLYSRRVDVPIEETEEQKASRIISPNPENHTNEPMAIYIHYYEVDKMDFDELMDSGFMKKDASQKIKDFIHDYKIPVK